MEVKARRKQSFKLKPYIKVRYRKDKPNASQKAHRINSSSISLYQV